MFEGISRYRGPYTGGALAILFYMMVSDLDIQLQQIYLEDIDDAFVTWCSSVIPHFPCAPEFGPSMSKYAEMMDNALIVFSGYESENYRPLYESVKKMEQQELQKRRWMMMPQDETESARLIAGRAYDEIRRAEASANDSDSLYLLIGLYVYMTVLCSPWYDAGSFRRLFVLSWLVYYSEVMSVPVGKSRR